MRIAWLTDLHLDHATPKTVKSFLTNLLVLEPDLILVGGDTGEAKSWKRFVIRIHERAEARVCFVLGNHDYYRGSIKGEQERAKILGERLAGKVDWLNTCRVELNQSACVVGEGGWGDGTHGEFGGMMLNDFNLIEELKCLDPESKRKPLAQLGRSCADRLKRKLYAVVKRYKRVIILTHVPPFAEASWHQDRPGNHYALPFFVWGQGGEMLEGMARTFPMTNFLVLCGHTHSAGMCMPLPNLTCLTADARYGHPGVQMINIPEVP